MSLQRRRHAAGMLLFLASFASFVSLAIVVRQQHQFALDHRLLTLIHAHSSHLLDSLFRIATNTGGIVYVTLISALLVGWLWRRHRAYDAAIVGLVILSTGLANIVAKAICRRPRPELWTHLVHETDYSFPSGHAMASASLAFCIVYVLWRSRYRGLSVVLAASYMVLVGYSRLYLGVHYPSDILGGWLLSGSLFLAIVSLVQRLRRAT